MLDAYGLWRENRELAGSHAYLPSENGSEVVDIELENLTLVRGVSKPCHQNMMKRINAWCKTQIGSAFGKQQWLEQHSLTFPGDRICRKCYSYWVDLYWADSHLFKSRQNFKSHHSDFPNSSLFMHCDISGKHMTITDNPHVHKRA